ncbi:AraC family transcriptional regulator [Metabacillus halosaccharovorans]|uniref:AraC family transcriptional regulator n=1 Tax=Metabacillus halosaccharovorans TaxID=930124 RepID=A0ABT3DAL9_9BACI|nr:AraC family transcriptional regulator [Metabacillus halosaccharovorans]MCV9884104.1 AraC family transcriptional regulator [Metabacillus halosaccharovorans]
MTMFLKTSIHTPIEFISGGYFMSETPWIHSKRNIDSFEIIIGVNKTLYMEQGEHKYEVNPGDVLLILPHQPHGGFATCEENVSFYWFHFLCSDNFTLIDEATMNEEIAKLRRNPNYYKSNTYIYIPMFFTPASIDRINIMFRQLLHVYRSNYYTYHSGHYLVTSLLIEVTEQIISNFNFNSSSVIADTNLNKIMEWTRIHALENITVTEIADKFNYNREYLSRYFKKGTGMTLIEYINLLKISKAKDYLSSTNDSIKEIAYNVGVQDEKYFMKLFKKYEKMTPTEYRESYFRTKMNKQ